MTAEPPLIGAGLVGLDAQPVSRRKKMKADGRVAGECAVVRDFLSFSKRKTSTLPAQINSANAVGTS